MRNSIFCPPTALSLRLALGPLFVLAVSATAIGQAANDLAWVEVTGNWVLSDSETLRNPDGALLVEGGISHTINTQNAVLDEGTGGEPFRLVSANLDHWAAAFARATHARGIAESRNQGATAQTGAARILNASYTHTPDLNAEGNPINHGEARDEGSIHTIVARIDLKNLGSGSSGFARVMGLFKVDSTVIPATSVQLRCARKLAGTQMSTTYTPTIDRMVTIEVEPGIGFPAASIYHVSFDKPFTSNGFKDTEVFELHMATEVHVAASSGADVYARARGYGSIERAVVLRTVGAVPPVQEPGGEPGGGGTGGGETGGGETVGGED